MLRQVMLWDIVEPTSSAEFPVGISPCGLPGGPTTDLSGPALALASPTRRRARASAMPTLATSGPSSSGSSASVALTQYLASKLAPRLGTDGSMEYRQTWKEKVTPLGRSYWVLIASARPISDNASTGWPTPRVTTNGGHGNAERAFDGRNCRLEDTVQLAGEPPTRQVLGATSTSSPAGTASRGVLNPAHSLWLLGFPSDWLMVAPVKASRVPRASKGSATRSSRRSRPSLSGPTSKPPELIDDEFAVYGG